MRFVEQLSLLFINWKCHLPNRRQAVAAIQVVMADPLNRTEPPRTSMPTKVNVSGAKWTSARMPSTTAANPTSASAPVASWAAPCIACSVGVSNAKFRMCEVTLAPNNMHAIDQQGHRQQDRRHHAHERENAEDDSHCSTEEFRR